MSLTNEDVINHESEAAWDKKMKQRINSGAEIQVLQVTHKLNWALATVKGIRELHEAKKKSFDLVDIRTHDFRITVVNFFLTID